MYFLFFCLPYTSSPRASIVFLVFLFTVHQFLQSQCCISCFSVYRTSVPPEPVLYFLFFCLPYISSPRASIVILVFLFTVHQFPQSQYCISCFSVYRTPVPPEVVVPPPKRLGQVLGKETILECTIFAEPQGVTAWEKDGIQLRDGQK